MAPSTVTLTTVFGSGLIGIIIAATLFGLYSSQMYSYFNYYSKDKLWMKLLVIGIWVVLALQYSLSLHAIYSYLIDDFGQDSKLAVSTWDWISYVILTSFTSVAVQLFFARRLFYLLHNRILKWISLIIITITSLLNFSFGVFLTAHNGKQVLFSSYQAVTWAIDIWLGASVVCDICITSFMIYALHKSRTGIKSTNRLINKFMVYSIQTGAVTSFVEILCLASFTASGFHFGHILVVFPLSGLYATSFLANLHARIPNTPGLDMYKGLVVSNTDVFEMSTNVSSQATKTAINSQPSGGNTITMSMKDRFLDYSLPEEDLLVKPPAAHNVHDIGVVV